MKKHKYDEQCTCMECLHCDPTTATCYPDSTAIPQTSFDLNPDELSTPIECDCFEPNKSTKG